MLQITISQQTVISEKVTMTLLHKEQQKVIFCLHYFRTHLLPDLIDIGWYDTTETGLQISLLVEHQHLLRRLIDVLNLVTRL